MNEPAWIIERYKEFKSRHPMQMDSGHLTMEDMDYAPEPISNFEEQNGNPYIVDILKLHIPYTVDPQVQIQGRSVEEYVKHLIQEEGLRDSVHSYNHLLERLLASYGKPLEMAMGLKENVKVLEHLFKEAALHEKMSGQTFMQVAKDKFKQEKVESLKKQLKQLLTI